MTKHRKREEWIEAILDAAAEEINAVGFAQLTMEAIAARSGLSKGGVYRFFANKREVSLALFHRIYHQLLDFKIDEVVSWRKPLGESIFRLLYAWNSNDEHDHNVRVWIQLIPETFRDEQFIAKRLELISFSRRKFRDLVARLAERDRMKVPEDLEAKTDLAVLFGIAFMEGLSMQGPAGPTSEVRGQMLRRVIQLMVQEVLTGNFDEQRTSARRLGVGRARGPRA